MDLDDKVNEVRSHKPPNMGLYVDKASIGKSFFLVKVSNRWTSDVDGRSQTSMAPMCSRMSSI